MNPLIHANELAVSFSKNGQSFPAVFSVSFDLRRGKTTAIVGESGSGKSVSSLALLNLHDRNSVIYPKGLITLDGQLPGTEQPVEVKPGSDVLTGLRGRKIAMIFQEPMTALNPVMTCGEQVVEMLQHHLNLSVHAARKEALRLFEEVRIPHPEQALDKFPHEMSGGQRQRVMIAMAISCRPDVLIADEPTTALDVTVQRAVLELLKELQVQYGMAILFITHDLGVVEEIADEVIVMERGRIVESGNTRDVLNNPSHPYTQRLIASRPNPGHKGYFLGPEVTKKALPVMDRGDAALVVNHLTKVYRKKKLLGAASDFRAVSDVSFSLHTGETLGLVGESGCGKTTLSRMLLGLIPPDSGEIILHGKSLTLANDRQRRQALKEIQIVFQDPYSALNPTMRIGQILEEPIAWYGLRNSAPERKHRVVELLHKVGLSEEHMNRYPHEFSGGQRQRIVIARALAVEPSVVVCDESVSALDVSVQAQVLNLLNELKHEFALSYLFISHDLNVVYYMSDRIMVMRKGVIEESGPAEQVFYHPQTAYTRSLLESIPGAPRVG
ncbi:MAG: ABC transporter ATP-binding protein [Flavobacteriales bacterium]|jgi:peptide/nickel transport system ATP-binding protein